MPFIYHGKKIEGTGRLEVISRKTISEVLSSILWEREGSRMRKTIILPNGYYYQNERGKMAAKDPRKYIALAFMARGIPLGGVGLWFDSVIEQGSLIESTGLGVGVHASPESLLRFDRRKPIYYLPVKNQPCRYFYLVD